MSIIEIMIATMENLQPLALCSDNHQLTEFSVNERRFTNWR
jgi:hypothetical protein